MDNSDFEIEDGVLEAYLGDTNINTLVIPEGVTNLGRYIFPDKIKDNLTIVFPSTLKKISAEEPFRGNNVSCLDFSKCKLTDLSGIKLTGTFEKIIMPTTITKFEPNFSYNNVVVASNGKESKTADFSMCTGLKYLSLKKLNKNVTFETYNVPDSVENFYIGDGYYNKNFIKDLRFSSKSKAKIIDAKGVDTVTVPKSVEELYANSAKWVFFADTALNLYEAEFNNAYVVENVNIDKVKLVDELATKGIEYYETSRGIFITKLNNDIAKLQDFPQTFDGKEVLGNTLFNPFSKEKTDESSLGALASKIKYRANRNLQKAEDIFKGKLKAKKSNPNSENAKGKSKAKKSNAKSKVNKNDDDEIDENDPWLNVWKVPKWKKRLAYLGGVVASYLVVTLIFLFFRYLAKQTPGSGIGDGGLGDLGLMIGIIPVGLFVSLAVDFFIVYRIISKIETGNIEKMNTSRIEKVGQKYGNGFLPIIYTQIDEPYKWLANTYARKLMEEAIQKKEEERRRKLADERFWDEYRNGSKEEQQRKAIASTLDDINKNLKSGAGSYDIYNKYGDKIGEVKKD